MGLLDALRDPQFRSDLGTNARQLGQSASNTIAEGVTMPVDALAWLLRKGGAQVPQTPVGGSDWAKQQGLMADVPQGAPKMAGEALGLLAPMAGTKQGVNALATALRKGGENLAAPAMLNKQAGKVFVYPQDEALATAQRNAAKPISEGGLGLPANNKPIDRAKALGFNFEGFHGTTNGDFGQFARNSRNVYFTTPDANFANRYTVDNAGDVVDSSNVLPLMVRASSPFDYKNKLDVNALSREASLGNLAENQIKKGDWRRLEDRTTLEAIKKIGKDGLYVNEDGVKNLAVFNPSQLRSRFAAFDPARLNDADLLGAADPRLLAILAAGAGGAAYRNKDK